MVEVLVEATGQRAERLTADLDRDFILRGQDAVDYGVVDQILRPRHAATTGTAATGEHEPVEVDGPDPASAPALVAQD
jgi:hypothetical protein